MAYTAFDTTKPDGSTQTGAAFSTSANANDTALLDMLGESLMQGYAYSQSGGTAEEPTQILLKNGTRWIKLDLTWTSGNVTGLTVSRSTNSGGVYDTVGSAAVFTYDGSGNLTASTNWGGLFLKLAMEIVGKYKATRTLYTAHAAATGTSVHGLGTMSTQAASAVAITGGSVSCTYEREAIQTLSNGNAANTLNWSLGGHATLTVTGTSCSISHSNLPSGVVGYQTIEVTNGGLGPSSGSVNGLITGLKNAGGVVQTFTTTGRDILVLMCRDGSTVNVVGFLKGMA